MTTWSKDELRKIAEADDLHISPFREDGYGPSVDPVAPQARLVTREIALRDVTDTLERMTRFDTVGFEVITRFA